MQKFSRYSAKVHDTHAKNWRHKSTPEIWLQFLAHLSCKSGTRFCRQLWNEKLAPEVTDRLLESNYYGDSFWHVLSVIDIKSLVITYMLKQRHQYLKESVVLLILYFAITQKQLNRLFGIT